MSCTSCYILGLIFTKKLNIMKKEKLYFKNIDDTTCYNLQTRLEDAQDEGLEEIMLIEAVLDNDNPDYVFCGENGEVTERRECRKSFCSKYESKSGRGICKHRGYLYCHGDEVSFAVPTKAGI